MRETPDRSLKLYNLSWPISVEIGMMTLIGTLGLWMAGHVSDGAVAVFGLSVQLRGIFDRVFRVVGIGASVIVTQHRGAGNAEGAQATARAGLAAAVWMGLAVMLLVSLLPAQLLALLQLPGELYEIAVPFFVLVGIVLMLESVTITMFSVLRAYTFTQDSMRMVMAMHGLQILISVPLVFGLAGLPELGLMGLGWAMVLSRLFALVLLLAIWARRLHITMRWREILLPARQALSPILHIGLPSAGEKIAFRICFLATVAMAGSLGTTALATHAYAWQLVGLINIVMIGLASGAEIIVGHHVGAGRLRDAHVVLKQALGWGMAATMASAVLVIFIAPPAIRLISGNPEIVALLVSVLLLELVLEPGRCINTVVTGGLRAAGDVRFPVKVSVLSNVVFGAGLAWLLGIHFGLGLPGIWLGYIADEWLRGLVMIWRWYRLGWAPHARAARRRVMHRRALKA